MRIARCTGVDVANSKRIRRTLTKGDSRGGE